MLIFFLNIVSTHAQQTISLLTFNYFSTSSSHQHLIFSQQALSWFQSLQCSVWSRLRYALSLNSFLKKTTLSWLLVKMQNDTASSKTVWHENQQVRSCQLPFSLPINVLASVPTPSPYSFHLHERGALPSVQGQPLYRTLGPILFVSSGPTPSLILILLVCP